MKHYVELESISVAMVMLATIVASCMVLPNMMPVMAGREICGSSLFATSNESSSISKK